MTPQIAVRRVTEATAHMGRAECVAQNRESTPVGASRRGYELKCTTCRECIRHEKFREVVDLGKIKDRFEFHIETIGVYRPEELVVEALKKLKEKAQHWLEVIEQQESGGAEAAEK